MVQQALEKIGERAVVRRLGRVFSLPQPASNVAPKTGVNADAKGEAKRGDAISHHPVGIKACRVFAENGRLYIGGHQVDQHVVIGFDMSPVGEREGFTGFSPRDGARGV